MSARARSDWGSAISPIVRFGENAGQAIDPAGFGDYARSKQTIDKQLGVSLDDDLIAQLTGNVSASVSLDGGFGVRTDLKDPRAFERTLVKVADVLPSFAQGRDSAWCSCRGRAAGRTSHVLSQRGGRPSRVRRGGGGAGGGGDVRRARELAGAEPVAVPGASGSVVAGADAQRLVTTLLERFGAAFGVPDLGALGTEILTRPLGDLRGSVSANTSELRGKLTLGFG